MDEFVYTTELPGPNHLVFEVLSGADYEQMLHVQFARVDSHGHTGPWEDHINNTFHHTPDWQRFPLTEEGRIKLQVTAAAYRKGYAPLNTVLKFGPDWQPSRVHTLAPDGGAIQLGFDDWKGDRDFNDMILKIWKAK